MTAEKEIDPDASLWHLLASEVRKRRKAKGWSQAQLASEAHSSESHVGSIETVARKPMLDTVQAYDLAVAADGSLVSIYRAARKASAGKPLWWEGHLQARELATRIRTFETQTIPGMLQTEGYIRELFRQVGKLPHEVDEQVAHRLARQKVLTKANPPQTWAVIDEAALTRLCFLPREVASEQLGHLLAMGELPHITIQVLPFDCGLHACMGGPIVLMSVPGRGEVVYCEAMSEGSIVTDDQAVIDMECRFDRMRGNALSPRRSAEYLRDLLEKL
ncbi:helix-turn-helix domain-containing protein [Yinghuangia sp. YIM S09857]|uniref:helix-turn-helix domain-containing protein n=1 Tax=Yinghuangia sp. YIM S09857 TaxID=3436929 RepID=UPI003F534F71